MIIRAKLWMQITDTCRCFHPGQDTELSLALSPQSSSGSQGAVPTNSSFQPTIIRAKHIQGQHLTLLMLMSLFREEGHCPMANSLSQGLAQSLDKIFRNPLLVSDAIHFICTLKGVLPTIVCTPNCSHLGCIHSLSSTKWFLRGILHLKVVHWYRGMAIPTSSFSLSMPWSSFEDHSLVLLKTEDRVHYCYVDFRQHYPLSHRYTFFEA